MTHCSDAMICSGYASSLKHKYINMDTYPALPPDPISYTLRENGYMGAPLGSGYVLYTDSKVCGNKSVDSPGMLNDIFRNSHSRPSCGESSLHNTYMRL